MRHPTQGKSAISAVLFDLDGTIADTAPDMAHSLNRLRARHGLMPLPLQTVRPHASRGARGMVGVGFGLGAGDPGYAALRDAFLEDYAAQLCIDTVLFPGIEVLLNTLDEHQLKWGIVTNKATRLTLPLLTALDLDKRAHCIVCGDTCARAKPHPDPLLHAAHLLSTRPECSIYVGDDERDIQAANAAGMQSVVALYGYLGTGTPPPDWNATHMLNTPTELMALI